MKISNYKHNPDVHNLNTPQIVVPILVKMFRPKNVLDVGCGLGNWLKVFMNNGVEDVVGLDCDNVSLDLLRKYLPLQKFNIVDLTKPFDLKKAI